MASENTNGPNATNEDNPMDVDNPMEVGENWPPLPLAVVSPPSAPNLTSLLTGHTGQEMGPQAGDEGTAQDKNNHSIHPQENDQTEETEKAPSKKKSKKSKTTKEDTSTKRDRSG
jgi:hypothetical protein